MKITITITDTKDNGTRVDFVPNVNGSTIKQTKAVLLAKRVQAIIAESHKNIIDKRVNAEDNGGPYKFPGPRVP